MFVLFGYNFRAQLGGNPLAGINMFNAGLRLVERCADGVMYNGLKACNDYTPNADRLRQVQCSISFINRQRRRHDALLEGAYAGR